MKNICNSCEEQYKRLAQHWALSDCEPQKFTDEQKEILTGLVMGDATVANRGKNPYIQVIMTNKKYLEQLSKKFKHLSSDVNLSQTASESANSDLKTGFNEKASAKNYKDVYSWRTITHEQNKVFSEWYSDEGKQFPHDIELSSTTLKHWYVCDGGLVGHKKDTIGISVVNESNSKSKIDDLFRRKDLPTPSHYNESENRCKAVWTKQDSKKLFNYMGEPVTGFAYKFLR